MGGRWKDCSATVLHYQPSHLPIGITWQQALDRIEQQVDGRVPAAAIRASSTHPHSLSPHQHHIEDELMPTCH